MTVSNTQRHNQSVAKSIRKKVQKQNCQNKKTYETLEMAQSSANRQHGLGLYLRPYCCGVCKRFHLSKRDKRNVLEHLFKQIEKERKTRDC